MSRTPAVHLADWPTHENVSFPAGATVPVPLETRQASTSPSPVTGRTKLGRPRRINTTARIQSTIKAVQGLGLAVGRVTYSPDGTVTVDINNQPAATKPNPKSPLASWDEALNDPNKTAIRQKIRRPT
jgi:hypothetical protein